MFFKIALAAIGVAIMLVIAYLVIAQARSSMPEATATNGVENITNALNGAQATLFAGFGIIAVGVIVLAAFGIISIWK